MVPPVSEYNSIANTAGVAQLVEHHVANVDVAGSNPVSRSFFLPIGFLHAAV